MPLTGDVRTFDELAAAAPEVLSRVLMPEGGWADLFLERTEIRSLRFHQLAAPGRHGSARVRAARVRREGAGLHLPGSAGAPLYAATEDLSPEALAGLPDRLTPADGGQVNANLSSGLHEKLLDAELQALAQEAADSALGLDENVRFVTIEARATRRSIAILLPDGVMRSRWEGHLGLRVEIGFAGRSGEVAAYAIGGVAGDERDVFALDPARIALEVVERARSLSRARSMRGGQMPVVLAPGWGGVWLHECAGHLFEADVSGVDEARPISSGITVVDDPTLEGGRGSYPWDDEGTPAQRTVLVEQGARGALLTDRQHSTLRGLPLTGNGRRQDYRFPPLPRMSNLSLSAGSSDPADLLASVQDGLYVAMIGGGKVCPEEDRYSFEVVEGYRIEAGRLTQPVTAVRIEGRLTGALEGIAGVGRDFAFDHARGTCVKGGQMVPVSVGMPTVLLRGLEVAATPVI